MRLIQRLVLEFCVVKISLIGPLRYELFKHGVRASEEGGVKLTDSDAVNAFLSLITLIEHPADGIARFHVAKYSAW